MFYSKEKIFALRCKLSIFKKLVHLFVKKQLIIIAGPTAVGKTALAIQLAKQYECPIISADSRQFYKEMTIGTAKPTIQELSEATHYFINNKSIHQAYNIGQYEKEVLALIEELFKTHQYLILVGGSGLYIHAVLNGVDEFEEIPPEIRSHIIENYQLQGITYLQNEVKRLDEFYFTTVDINNPQRLMRALEVCMHTGKPFSEYRTKTKKERFFNAIPILVNTTRELLYQRINARVDAMMQQGLMQEVTALYPHKNLNALNTVGYKELIEVIAQKTTLEKAVELIKQNTRRYAKRQLTWFNHQGNFTSFDPTDFEKIIAYIHIISEHS